MRYQFIIGYTTDGENDPEMPDRFTGELAALRTTDGFVFLAARHTETVTVDGVQVWADHPPTSVIDDWEEAVEISSCATGDLRRPRVASADR